MQIVRKLQIYQPSCLHQSLSPSQHAVKYLSMELDSPVVSAGCKVDKDYLKLLVKLRKYCISVWMCQRNCVGLQKWEGTVMGPILSHVLRVDNKKTNFRKENEFLKNTAAPGAHVFRQLGQALPQCNFTGSNVPRFHNLKLIHSLQKAEAEPNESSGGMVAPDVYRRRSEQCGELTNLHKKRRWPLHKQLYKYSNWLQSLVASSWKFRGLL